MSASDTVSRTVALRRVDSADSAARVRHVDELSDAALEQFYRLCRSGTRSVTTASTSFVDGEVIVFTDYYRIEFL